MKLNILLDNLYQAVNRYREKCQTFIRDLRQLTVRSVCVFRSASEILKIMIFEEEIWPLNLLHKKVNEPNSVCTNFFCH